MQLPAIDLRTNPVFSSAVASGRPRRRQRRWPATPRRSRNLLPLLAALAACAGCAPESASTLITNAIIVDGTGAPTRPGAVRILDDRIVAVGELEPRRGETVIDAGGLVLAPGFIDTHSHHDLDLERFPDMPAVLSQGVTTIVRGNDGLSIVDKERKYVPLDDFRANFSASPAAVNVASFAPHNSIRFAVMGDDYRRAATPDETEQMAALVAADMAAGAIGLSTGLEYDPGIHAPTEEVIALANVAARHGGLYASHVRDEDDLYLDALRETIRIGREAGIAIHVSHIKLADRTFWGTTADVLALLDAARADGITVSADVYPYLRWQSSLAVLFPDRDFASRETAKYTFAHTASPADIVLADFPPNPDINGMSIAEVAKRTGRDEIMTLLELSQAADRYLQETGMTGSSIIARGMDEADVIRFLQWPHTVICSDGRHASGHPRGHGAFPRVFRRYVRELGVLTLEEAVRKMTLLSADVMGLAQRGRISAGAYADLVLFDPERIADRATMAEPTLLSTGIDRVWVNGVLAYAAGAPTAARAGRILAPARR